MTSSPREAEGTVQVVGSFGGALEVVATESSDADVVLVAEVVMAPSKTERVKVLIVVGASVS